jgi:hypothetical protein
MPGSGPTKEPASTRKILGIIGVSFLLLVLVCLVAVTLLGRSSTNDTAGGAQDVGSSSSYSDVQHKAFVDSCVQAGGATRGQCECAFTVVEGMYAPDELDKVGADYERTGVYPAELTSAIRSRCA